MVEGLIGLTKPSGTTVPPPFIREVLAVIPPLVKRIFGRALARKVFGNVEFSDTPNNPRQGESKEDLLLKPSGAAHLLP